MHERNIGAELGMLNNLLRRQMACMVSPEEADVTGMQAMIIHHLLSCRDAGDCFQKDIETQFRIRRSTATGMLKLLESRGFIIREPVKYDARLKRLVLTEKSRALDEHIRRKIKHAEEVMSRDIPIDELDTWFRVCDRIRTNLEHYQMTHRRESNDT